MKYYCGDRAYVRRGAPPAYLRILGWVLIAGTVVLAAGGAAADLLARTGGHAGDYLHLYPPHYWRAGQCRCLSYANYHSV